MGLLAGRGIASAAVVIPAEAPPVVASAPLPTEISLAGVPATHLPAMALAVTAPDGFELGQITATPEDLRTCTGESDRPLMLALLVASLLPLGLFGQRWWVGCQITARRN